MSATTSKEPTPLDRAIAKYLALVDAGEPIDRERFLKEHSGVADELQAFWDASDDIEQMAGPQAGSDDGQTMLNQVKESGAHDTAESMALETQMPRRMRTEEPVSLPHEFGRYRLTRLLGEGAMGSVYLAWDSQLERDVALKMPKFDGDDRQRLIERFYTEARAAATLSHPNLCPVYDVGEFEGRHFLTMALVNGQTLSRYIGSERQQSEKHVVALVRKLALALQEAHQKGVVHRDLKPGNIMIDQRGEPIVMDFGLARRFDDAQGVQVRATKSGELIGTPAYMSPEQVEGTPEGVGPATDIYSLGVIFYELLTSRLPFTGSVGAVMGQILHKEPADVTELRPETDPRVAQICRRMMAKKAEDRFESMGEVAEWLSMVLRSQITAPAGEEKPAKQKKTKQAAAPGPVPAAGVQAFKSEDRAALAEAARACIRNHDYAQAREVLEKIPGSYRDEEVQELLKKSVELQDEVDFLIADMEQAVRLKEYKGLKTNIKRLLKLKPGYKPAKQLLEELNTYSSGEMKRRDSEGPAHYHKEEGLLRPLIIGGVFVAILFGAAWFGITFYLKTTAGTVKVTVYDPSVTVSLDKEVLTLVNDGVTTTVRMGEHTLLVERPGLNAEALTFMVEKGDDKVFRVELLEGELAIVEGAGGSPPAQVTETLTAESESNEQSASTEAPIARIPTEANAESFQGIEFPDDYEIASLEVGAQKKGGSMMQEITTLPPSLSGRMFTWRTGIGDSIRFRVVENRTVLLAMCDGWDGGPNLRDITPEAEFEAQQWREIAKLNLCRSPYQPDRPTIGYTVYVRECRAGEEFEIKNHRYHGPFLISGDAESLLPERDPIPADQAAIERRVAEYVVSVGGWVEVEDNEERIVVEAGGALPEEDFYVTKIHIDDVDGLAQMSEDDATLMADLSKLEYLVLKRTGLTDPGLSHLSGLAEIKYLNLALTQVTTLAPLKNCAEMERIYISTTPLTDEGAAVMKEFSKLQYVQMTGTNVTPKMAAELRTALPNCTFRGP